MQEEKKDLEEYLAKRQKRGKREEESPAEEKTILHGTGLLIVYTFLNNLMLRVLNPLSNFNTRVLKKF